MNFLQVFREEIKPVNISGFCRSFSVSLCLNKTKDKAARREKLMAVKVRRMKLNMRMVRKHPFNPNIPLTAKHVGPKRLGGSKEIQDKVALHCMYTNVGEGSEMFPRPNHFLP